MKMSPLTKFLLYLGFGLGSISHSPAQMNLVPNPSFEEYRQLPCSWTTHLNPLSNYCQEWTMPTLGSTDLYSLLVEKACFSHCQSENEEARGIQEPRSGKFMSAILSYGSGCDNEIDYREYLQVELKEALQTGQSYYGEFYVSLCDYSQFASGSLGMYFSDTLIQSNFCHYLDFEPQIVQEEIITEAESWVKISGVFTAESNARYLIIGNFKNNAQSPIIKRVGRENEDYAAYFVDDVLVIPLALSQANLKNEGQ